MKRLTNFKYSTTQGWIIMKLILLIPGLLFSLFSVGQSYNYKNPAIDVKHYTFDVMVNDDNNRVEMLASIQFNVLQQADKVSFDLVSQKPDGKGMKVSKVTIDSLTTSFIHNGNTISVAIPRSRRGAKKHTVNIEYGGIPADGLIISTNKYKRRTFFSDNWPNRAHNWLVSIDHPSDKATVDFIINAPSHYTAISNGIQLEETSLPGNWKITRYRETTALPTKVMVVGLADFSIQHLGEVDCIPVSSWVYAEERERGTIDYAPATDALQYFIRNVGPFGYRKLANVQSKTIFGGMENAGAIFYAENSITGNAKITALVAHEVAHQWFGNMATEIHWSHLWLSEGFATYMSMLYMEHKYGRDTLVSALMDDRKKIIAFSKKRSTPVVDTTITNYMELLNANSYDKGSWVLHMLRAQMGDSIFWKSVRTYYQQYAGKNASTSDLQKVMEDVSGKKLGDFFQQWLFRPGQPQLDISWNYDASKKQVSVSVNQLQDQAFSFPIQFGLVGKKGEQSISEVLQVTGKKAEFTIASDLVPTEIVIDPNVNLLFEGKIRKQ